MCNTTPGKTTNRAVLRQCISHCQTCSCFWPVKQLQQAATLQRSSVGLNLTSPISMGPLVMGTPWRDSVFDCPAFNQWNKLLHSLKSGSLGHLLSAFSSLLQSNFSINLPHHFLQPVKSAPASWRFIFLMPATRHCMEMLQNNLFPPVFNKT